VGRMTELTRTAIRTRPRRSRARDRRLRARAKLVT
jgi:hypothetical protein